LSAIADCGDVDLAVTPATNTLAVRRLDLEIGKREQETAVWARAIQPLAQHHTRLTKDRYRYESATGFSAEITADDEGLILSYPSGWERIGSL
jgi:hypothetical protein